MIEATNEDEEQYNDVIKKIQDEDKGNIEQKKSQHASRSINTSQTNVFNKIIKGNNSVQSAIIFKEIFDKPRSQRRKIR